MWSRTALLCGLLCALGACAITTPDRPASAGGPGVTPQRVLDAARARTVGAPTGEFTMTFDAPGFERLSTGAFDAPGHRYRFQPDPATEIRLVDGRAFVRSVAVAQRLGIATEWMTGRTGDGTAAFGAAEPLAFIDLLGGATGPVVDVGGGRFRLTLSPSAALATATPEARDRLQQALANELSSASLLTRALPVTARIDAVGFVDEVVVDLGSGVTLAVSFDHLGEPVTIDAPSPSQVTDVGAMLGR